jgi:hypothetical protein
MSTTVSELVIIESLPSDERQTGTELHQSLRSGADFEIPATLIRVTTAAELLAKIVQMREHAAKAGGLWIPMVHLEIHGDVEQQGLVMSSGEFLSWNDLAAAIRELNIAVKNSIVVVLGVCSGAFLMTGAATSPFERSPFYGIIGPHTPVTNEHLVDAFRAFYSTLIRTGDFVAAVNELRQRIPEYGGYHTAMLFRIGWEKYKGLSFGGKLADRVRRIMRRMPPSEIQRYGGRNKARLAIAEKIRTGAENRDRHYHHFIMADLYPENLDRFPADAA